VRQAPVLTAAAQFNHDDANVPVFRVFYWFGHYYSLSLLVQAVIMIAVQVVLLKVALDNRPSPGVKNSVEHVPFSNLDEKGFVRPYEFWQWKSAKPYVLFQYLSTRGLGFDANDFGP
jgi:hypothetical protein